MQKFKHQSFCRFRKAFDTQHVSLNLRQPWERELDKSSNE